MKFDYDSRYYLKSPFPKHRVISSRLYRRGQVFGFAFEDIVENCFTNIVLCEGQQKYDCWNIDTRANLEIRTYGNGSRKLNLRQSKMQGIYRPTDMAEHVQKNRKQDGYLVGIRKDYDNEYYHVLMGFIPSEYVIENELLEMNLDELNEFLDFDDTTFDELSNKFRHKKHHLARVG